MRGIKIGLLLAFAMAFGYVGVGTLSNLWADYRDGAVSTYLLIGLPALALAIASAVGAILALRGR